MALESLKDIFMTRDGLTSTEAEDLVAELRGMVAEGMDPEEVLYDVGLEPDYIWELL